MGSLRKSALLGTLLFVVSSAGAIAADLGRVPPPIYVPPVPYEVGSNWYLRADLGYKWFGTPDAHYDDPSYLTDQDGGNFLNETITNTGVAGIGYGYKFTNNFRADVTLHYEWPGHFHGNLHCIDTGVPCGANDYSDEYADISAWTGLVNGYLDLGNFYGFTPYVGAGLGMSYLTVSNVHYINPANSDSPGPGSWSGSKSKWNFAWSLTAGASFNITRDWLIDVNYRYVNLGDAESVVIPALAGTEPIRYDNITAQEVRVGLRFLIN